MLLQFKNIDGALFTIDAQKIAKVKARSLMSMSFGGVRNHTEIHIIGGESEIVNVSYETVIKAWETALGMHEKPDALGPGSP